MLQYMRTKQYKRRLDRKFSSSAVRKKTEQVGFCRKGKEFSFRAKQAEASVNRQCRSGADIRAGSSKLPAHATELCSAGRGNAAMLPNASLSSKSNGQRPCNYARSSYHNCKHSTNARVMNSRRAALSTRFGTINSRRAVRS